MSNRQLHTLREDMDSGKDVRQFLYRSKIQITQYGAHIYRVVAIPNGDGQLSVEPKDPPLREDEGYKFVGIPLWQHESDERCTDSDISQLAS